MHSKVIIASLVCALAASFNAGRGITANSAEAIQPEVKETVNHAPNDYQKNYWFSEQEGDTLYQFTVTVSFEKEYQNFQILRNDDDIEVSYSFYDDYAEITITAPDSNGGHFIQFGYRSGSKNIVLTTIYIYVRLGNYAASAYSMDDAKSRLFRYQEMTYDEREKISYRDESNFSYGYYTAYDPSRYTAEVHHANYVYGASDYDYDFLTSPRANSSTTKLILHANWVDKDGHYHPLAGVRADFMTQYSLLGQGDLHFTDAEGKYVVDVPTSGLNVNDVRCRLSSVSRATAVEDNFYQNYPLCYTLPYGTPLSNYFELDLFLYIFADSSDRGAAYEITQAQSVPYNYVETFTGDPVDTIVTRFPSAHTDYVKNRVQFIDIQKEDAHSWDVMNHEYGHFISDQLGLCNVDGNRNPHYVHANLGEDGVELAYTEGLATYLGLAAQMYYADSFDIAGYGDELYQDTYRDFTVYYDRFAPAYGGSGRMYGERYESSTTAMMIKMLDNVNRYDDEVALGHARMWNILLSCGSWTIVDFINSAIDLYPSYASAINHMREIEMIAEYLIHSYDRAAWTIMIYMCGADLQSYAISDIQEMLSVSGQPSNVNIILEIGGSTSWGSNAYGISSSYLNRYYVRNKQLKSAGKITNADMAAQSTFEDFLNWGFKNYPATKTGVIMWDHGGALEGVCQDFAHGYHILKPSSMKNAFANTFYKNRIDGKLEFIAYSACLMQVQDIADFNAPYFKYMVASEEVSTALGFKYDQWLDDLYSKKNTLAITKEIVDTYMPIAFNDSTMSVLDLSQVATYKNSFETLASQVKTKIVSNASARAAFKNILLNTKEFYHRDFGTIDGYDFLVRLQNSSYFSAQYSLINTVKNKYQNNLVVYERHNPDAGGSHGLAIFSGLNSSGGTYSYPSAQTNFTSWKSVVSSI